MDPLFLTISGVATAFGIAFAISVRGITYTTPDTDNELMAYAAAQSYKWRIPSDIHKHGAGKTRMKDMAIVLLAIMQFILRDKKTDFPYTVLTGSMIALSTVIIFIIGNNLFNPSIGFITSFLYITSFWPWQVSLYGGHTNIANAFFLAATLIGLISGNNFLLLGLAGILMCCSLFSSASSTKLIIPFWTTIFYAQHRQLIDSRNFLLMLEIINPQLIAQNIMVFIVVLGLGYAVVLLCYKPVVRLIYNKSGPAFLNNLISNRSFNIDHFQAHAAKKIKQILRWAIGICLGAIILFSLIPLTTILWIIGGFVIWLLFLTAPNIFNNIHAWFKYFLIPQHKTHFDGYVDYFAKRNIKIKRNTRGAGLSWIPKLLWTFAPFHLVLFISALSHDLYVNLYDKDIHGLILLFFVSITALLPILWAEITKAPQISRSYSSSIVVGLLLPAYVASNINWGTYSISALFIFITTSLLWNLWKFVDDVYPARMTVRNLIKIIDQLNIQVLYTYKTDLNNFFVYAIPGIGKSTYVPEKKIESNLSVKFIESLEQVQDGWIAIPGINPLDPSVTGELAKNYAADSMRDCLIETRQMDRIATAKFKTYITSKIWLNEDDITSYRYLYLKDVKPDDIYRGYAWLVHSSAIKKWLAEDKINN